MKRATASNTGGYAGTETATTTVKNTDDDTNGLTIAQTGTTSRSDLLTTEAGSTSTFTVVLDANHTESFQVIVTKHRNRPAGTVKLLFEPRYTRFRNLAA